MHSSERSGFFSAIPQPIRARMRELEAIDQRDRVDGTAHLDRLRQVPSETGRFLALMALMSPDGPMLELGTSAGYSTLWLALACRKRGQLLTTCELLPAKVALARETLRTAAVEDVVQCREGDALELLQSYDTLAFCFWDCDKARSMDYYLQVVPRLLPGGLFLADNAISHLEAMGPMLDRAQDDSRVVAVVVPIGKGVLVCRRTE